MCAWLLRLLRVPKHGDPIGSVLVARRLPRQSRSGSPTHQHRPAHDQRPMPTDSCSLGTSLHTPGTVPTCCRLPILKLNPHLLGQLQRGGHKGRASFQTTPLATPAVLCAQDNERLEAKQPGSRPLVVTFGLRWGPAVTSMAAGALGQRSPTTRPTAHRRRRRMSRPTGSDCGRHSEAGLPSGRRPSPSRPA